MVFFPFTFQEMSGLQIKIDHVCGSDNNPVNDMNLVEAMECFPVFADNLLKHTNDIPQSIKQWCEDNVSHNPTKYESGDFVGLNKYDKY